MFKPFRELLILYEVLECEKEYVSCYAEMEHFRHIHVHVFAKPHDLPEEWKGGKSFACSKYPQKRPFPLRKRLRFVSTLNRSGPR